MPKKNILPFRLVPRNLGEQNVNAAKACGNGTRVGHGDVDHRNAGGGTDQEIRRSVGRRGLGCVPCGVGSREVPVPAGSADGDVSGFDVSVLGTDSDITASGDGVSGKSAVADIDRGAGSEGGDHLEDDLLDEIALDFGEGEENCPFVFTVRADHDCRRDPVGIQPDMVSFVSTAIIDCCNSGHGVFILS